MDLVLTADDFGFSDDTITATTHLLEDGTVRNASIMPNVPATGVALEYARQHPQYCYGVHITLVRDGPERPLLNPASVPALVDGSGRFRPGRDVQIRALLGRLPPSQLEAEIEAQLARVIDAGVRIDYVDSHKHIHKYPCVQRVLSRVLPRFGITRVRRPQNVYLTAAYTRPTYWLGTRWGHSIDKRWISTDAFYMSTAPSDLEWTRLLAVRPEWGTLEVGAHPGEQDQWRVREAVALQRLASEATESGHVLRAWREVS